MFVTTTAIAAALAALFAGPPMTEAEQRALHERVLTLDTHIDIGDGYATHRLDPGRFIEAQADFPKMRAGGLDAGFFIIYTAQGPLTDEGYAAARAHAENSYQAINRMITGYPSQIGLARTADEAEAIHASGRLMALIGMENAYPLGLSVDNIPLWAERGVRYVSLSHFGNSQFGGSSNPNLATGESPIDPGLSDLGKELVEALNDHGIMVDISHVGPRTGMEALEMSRAPVIASHSGAREVLDHPRNLTDDQLRAIRDNNGVAQMVALRSYVRQLPPEMIAERDALREELGLMTREGRAAATDETRAEYARRWGEIRARYDDVTVADFVDHIDHAVEIAGIDHVGIASDFDGGGGVEGWDDASETFAVTQELISRGYSEEDIAKIWGGNLLRVMRAVEEAAR